MDEYLCTKQLRCVVGYYFVNTKINIFCRVIEFFIDICSIYLIYSTNAFLMIANRSYRLRNIVACRNLIKFIFYSLKSSVN